tara:strand:+ start:10092 stop:10739 length:648 start_codon:yes stop_codon:yes gene_type:complete
MASISYFSLLPNFEYINPNRDGGRKKQYVEVKNLFMRMKIKDSAAVYATNFRKYDISEGERPDNVAQNLYGDPNYDWVVLLTANIINARDEWPLSTRLLYDYAEEKYEEDLNATRQFETKEVRDSKGRLLMPGGQVVDSTFRIPDPENPGQLINPTVAVSNWLMEVRENNKKRTIRVLRSEYLSSFVSEVRDFLQYQESSQYDSNTGKKTAFENI